MRRFSKLVISFALLILVWSLGMTRITQGDTTTVCSSGCDYTTIQAAISAAAPNDVINIMAGTYVENVTVNKNLTLHGTGNTTVDGNASGSVFDINAGVIATISDVTITNGYADSGGGINNQGTLTLDNSVIISNSVVNHGGGVYNNGGVATINNSMVVSNSSLNGGGLMNDHLGVMTVNNSTITDNRRANGGGINNNNGSILTVNTCTISSNRGSFVGGIYSFSPITVTNSTVYSNTSYGLRIWGDTLRLANTIVANNANDDCEAVVGGTIMTLGHNLDSDGSCGLGGVNDQPSTDPMLGPLADNGGDTFTHALPLDSPAVDRGSCNGAGIDQRGRSRPADIPNVPNADDGCDIGAYEALIKVHLPLVFKS